MGYYDIEVIIEGALDESRTFWDTREGRLAKATFLGNLERQAKSESFTAEVFELFHDHESSVGLEIDDCSCAQYVLDHHPTYVFN
jgi:hypothetical protein